MANKIGTLKAYHNGAAVDVADIFDAKQAALNLAVRHGGAVGYIALTSDEPNADVPCLSIWHGGTKYRAMIQTVVIASAVINRTRRADGKIISRKYSHVNPAADDSDIAAFFNRLNSLSNNTKQEILRVNKSVKD